MKKTLYSLMLSEEVVREVDALAHRLGTNRSNLINQILADYVSVTTPERRINDIFQAVEQMLAPSRELVPFFAPNALTMSLKSSLEYKYRPTVKYEVQLFRSGEGSLGELSVVFRTQSAALIASMSVVFCNDFIVTDAGITLCLRTDIRVGGVYSVNIFCKQQCVSVNLSSAERRCRIRGKERRARTAGKDNNRAGVNGLVRFACGITVHKHIH